MKGWDRISSIDRLTNPPAGASAGQAPAPLKPAAPVRTKGRVSADARKSHQKRPSVDPLLLAAWHDLPDPTPEFRFCPPRRWRFDYAWPRFKVALEVEGGVWTGGRHTRGAGFVADMEKYNRAAVYGWRVVRCVPSELTSRATVGMLKDLLIQ